MSWKISIIDEAQKDYKKLDNGVRKQVLAGILKVSKAPLPSPDGYGNPLGNKNGNNLTGFFKIKYKGIDKHIMNIVVISPRDDNYCYELAKKIYAKYGKSLFKDIFDSL